MDNVEKAKELLEKKPELKSLHDFLTNLPKDCEETLYKHRQTISTKMFSEKDINKVIDFIKDLIEKDKIEKETKTTGTDTSSRETN